ncbi:MAG: GGDEF domain-containing protein [Eubacteriales bacterium]|nr:GGDEF domain-containing protein [Eubacteriales bacterium]
MERRAKARKGTMTLRQTAVVLDRNRSAVRDENYTVLWKLCLATAILLLVVFSCSYFVPHLTALRPLFLVFFLINALIFTCVAFFVRYHRKLVNAVFYAYIICMFAFGFAVGIFFSDDSVAGLFFVVQVAMPLTIIERPDRLLLLSGLFTVAFCICSYFIKGAAIFAYDITDAAVGYMLSSFLMFSITQMRITNIDTRRRLLQQSMTDELTHLPNRRRFNQYMHENIGRILDPNTNVALFMSDIDFFKRYNDTYGHLGGDDCLAAVASMFIAFAKRNNLFVARYGGEEFVAISIGGSSVDALSLAEELVQNMRRLAIPNSASIFGIVTISVGAVSARSYSFSNDVELINLADAALYEAKENGRNQCRVYT